MSFTTVADESIKLLQAVIWPVTILVIVIIFRKQIPKLVEGLSRRVSKVSLASISLELAVAQEVAPAIWQSLGDLKEPTSQQVGDSGQSLFRLMKGGEHADFARIDLGAGNQWLTSRLYMFALIPFRLLRLRAVVFVETRDRTGGRFVGIASPEAVRNALGRRYGWLEGAWFTVQLNPNDVDPESMEALRNKLKDNSNSLDTLGYWTVDSEIRRVVGSAFRPADLRDPQAADSLAQSMMGSLLVRREVETTSPPTNGWLRLGVSRFNPEKVREERAQWIESGADLDRILGGSLLHEYVVESAGVSRRELHRQAVLYDSEFVAVLDPEYRFKRLLHRQAIIERLSRDAAEREAP